MGGTAQARGVAAKARDGTGGAWRRLRARGGARPIWPLVAVTMACLVTLLVLPMAVGHLTSGLRRDIADVVEPAHTELTRIEFAQARQAAAIRGYLLTGDETYRARYRVAAGTESDAFRTLAPLVKTLRGSVTSPMLLDLQRAAAGWRSLNDALLAGRVERDAYLSRLSKQGRDYETILVSAQSLEDGLQAEAAARRTRIAELERTQRIVSVALVLLALAAAVIVFGLGRALERRRAAAEESETWSRELAGMVEALSATLDVGQVLEQAANGPVPGLADGALALLLDPRGRVERSAAQHRDPERAVSARQLAAVVKPSDLGDDPSASFAAGAPRVVTPPPPADGPAGGLLAALAPRSAIVAPFRSGERVRGALVLLRGGRRPAFTALDAARAGELAERAALALHNALLHEETEAALRTRDEVLAVVSHDLRNPLNAILMSTELMELRLSRGELDGESLRRQVSVIRRSVEQSARLIGDLLEVGRIERGRLSIHPESSDAARLVRDALDLNRPVAVEKGVELEAECDAPGRVHADRDRVLQVFSNLIVNAVRYSPDGGRVCVRARREEQDVLFEVGDDGPGVPPDERPHLFTAFWQGSHPQRGGAGLGLAICRGIVEAHGGSIEAECPDGGGTIFRFRLPGAGEAAPATAGAAPADGADVA